MRLPITPVPQAASRISPSLYEALLSCPAKASWQIGGERNSLPSHPAALLGIAFHGVLEAVHRGEITGDSEEKRSAARIAFDRLATEAYDQAHPLVRLKFPTPDRLPYYNQQKELAALLAAQTQEPASGKPSEGAGKGSGAERWFESDDGLIGGRPDFLNAGSHEVVDYKTGYVGEGGGMVSDRERRQLALYAFLAGESGISITQGRIVRANGLQATVSISADDATAEADAARNALAKYNNSVSTSSFQSLAVPSPESCKMCECKPLCDAFWNAADDDWQKECGIHVEGEIVECSAPVEVQGTKLITMKVQPTRGTVIVEGLITIPQIPIEWFTADGDDPPVVGDRIRLVDGRLVSDEDPTIVQGDRIMTTLWRVDGAEAVPRASE